MQSPLPSSRLLAIIETQNRIAATALNLEAVMSLVVERAQALTGAQAAVIELVDGEQLVYHVGHGAAEPYVGLRLAIDSSLSGRCVRERMILHCHDAADDDRVDLEACRRVGAISMVCVPLSHDGRIAGVLKVSDPRPNVFSQADVATLDLLSGVIAAHMAHAADFALTHHESQHDALTGLQNRRAFDRHLQSELSRLHRHGGQLTVCLIDLDRFKQVNDVHGHGAGDAVLRAVAGHLAQTRGEDAVFRLGGDEFAVILVQADRADAAMERLTQGLEHDPDCCGVGISWGAASFREADDLASIVSRADLALYDAKRAIAK